MLSHILFAIIAIIVWEKIKDILNIRNIFDKYDGLSSDEKIAIKIIEKQEKEKRREKEKKEKKNRTTIDD